MTDGEPRTVVLTAHELAERWRVAVSQIYRLTRERKLPAMRIGRYYRYSVDAVEQFEREGGEGPDYRPVAHEPHDTGNGPLGY